MSLNKVFLVGNIGVLSELKETKTGGKYLNFSLATNKKVKNENGEYEKQTEWHNIVAFNKPAENIFAWSKPGTKIFVEGEIQSSKYKNKDGVEMTGYKILCNGFEVLTNSKEKEDKPIQQEMSPATNLIDDDIPF